MKRSSRKHLNAFTIDFILDRMACLDPSKLGHFPALESGEKVVSKSKASHHLDKQKSSAKSSHQETKTRRLPAKGRLEVCKYLPSVTSTVPTASISDATPWSEHGDSNGASSISASRSGDSNSSSSDGSDSSDNSYSNSSASSRSSSSSYSSGDSTSSGSDDEYDDKINLVIKVKTSDDKSHSILPESRPPAIAPVVPPPPRSAKTFFLRPTPPKPFGSPLPQEQRKPSKRNEQWKGKRVKAARCVGPF